MAFGEKFDASKISEDRRSKKIAEKPEPTRIKFYYVLYYVYDNEEEWIGWLWNDNFDEVKHCVISFQTHQHQTSQPTPETATSDVILRSLNQVVGKHKNVLVINNDKSPSGHREKTTSIFDKSLEIYQDRSRSTWTGQPKWENNHYNLWKMWLELKNLLNRQQQQQIKYQQMEINSLILKSLWRLFKKFKTNKTFDNQQKHKKCKRKQNWQRK